MKLHVYENMELTKTDIDWINTNVKEEQFSGNVSVNGNVNDTCKRYVNFELTQSKQQIITELAQCNYRTSPKAIAGLLEQLFTNCFTNPGHWLFIAQHYNPRAINRTINRLVKLHNVGSVTIQNPAAYFTYLIKYRKKRRDKYISMIPVNNKYDNSQ